MTDLLAGQVNLMFDNLPSALAQIQAGKVKALAVTSIKRASYCPPCRRCVNPGCPDTKSIRGSACWRQRARRRSACARSSRRSTKRWRCLTRKRIEQLGAEPGGEGSAAFAAEIKADTDKWSRVIKSAGIKAQ
jgi:tripartite-type tricarboxylate transporter receptor subunit TctC